MKRCKRCGKCCHRGDFWQYSYHEAIFSLVKKLRKQGKAFAEEGRCQMLVGENICFLEAIFGRDAKPEVCKEYVCECEGLKK